MQQKESKNDVQERVQAMGSSIGSMSTFYFYNFLKRTDLHLMKKGNNVYIYKGRYAKKHGAKRKKSVENNLEKRKYQGKITANSRKYIMKKLATWGETIEYYNNVELPLYNRRRTALVFLTLTLPSYQHNTDQEIKQNVLNEFLYDLKIQKKIDQYFWKAESQKNGNIHFHLIIDSYVEKELVQKLWNRHLERYDYVTLFHVKHGHRNPPTTRIEAPKGIRNVHAYMMKYVTKKDNSRAINGKLWGMSTGLREVRPFTMENRAVIQGLLKWYMENYKENVYMTEHSIRIHLTGNLTETWEARELSKQNDQYLNLLYYLFYRHRHTDDTVYCLRQFAELDHVPDELIDMML